MTPAPKSVWITRTRPGADRTAARVRALGHRPLVAPLLVVEATDAAPAPQGWDIAFTSPNGVAHYRGATGSTAWCVGAATAEAARAAGFADVRTGPGDVEGLTGLLLAEGARPLLHWAGAHVRGALVETLRKAGREAGRRTAYRARAVEALPPDVAEAAPVDAVLFHSPRASEVFAALSGDRRLALTSVCLSPATDAPLGGGLATKPAFVRCVATRPTEDALMDALVAALDETREGTA